METLHELVKSGKVRALGASAMYGYQFHTLQIAAKDHGWTPYSSKSSALQPSACANENKLLTVALFISFARCSYC